MATKNGIGRLVPYTQSSYPTLPDGESTYLDLEFRKVALAIKTIGELLRSGQNGVTIKAGPPTTTDLPEGTSGVFKDTSGGGVYLAYNDAGTIKKVALV